MSVATIARYVRDFSIEVLPAEIERGAALDVLPPGTDVFLTRVPGAAFDATLRAVRSVAAAGMHPVPHVTARSLRDERDLRDQIGALAGAGVDEVLLVAGSYHAPDGSFADTASVLETGVFEAAGIRRIGVAGHPEGHPGATGIELDAALLRKAVYARERGLDLYAITQFFFDSEPVLRYERRLRDLGMLIPVRAGFHGVTGPADLLRLALLCGIGPSLKLLAGRPSAVGLAFAHAPSRLVAELAAAAQTPGSLLHRAHFFPLGAFASTAAWARALAESRFGLAADGTPLVNSA